MGATSSKSETSIIDYDNRDCLIRNLALNLSKHLRNLNSNSLQIIDFINHEWLPLRKETIETIEFLIRHRKKENEEFNGMQVMCKSTSAAGKVVAISGIFCWPLAIVGTIFAVSGEIGNHLLSKDRANMVEGSVRYAESALRTDMNLTKKLQNLISGHKLLLKNFEDSIKELHKAARSGHFDRPDNSPSTQKMIAKMKSVESVTPESKTQILMTVQTYSSEFFSSHSELLSENPDFRDVWTDSVHIYRSGLALIMILSGGVVGACVGAGINAFSLINDLDEIGRLIIALKGDGTDEIVSKLEEILTTLQDEFFCVETGVKSAIRPQKDISET